MRTLLLLSLSTTLGCASVICGQPGDRSVEHTAPERREAPSFETTYHEEVETVHIRTTEDVQQCRDVMRGVGIFLQAVSEAAQAFQNAGSYRGCCSYHGGISYCGGSQLVCADGWVSSCQC